MEISSLNRSSLRTKPFPFSIILIEDTMPNEYEIDFEGRGVRGEHRKIYGNTAQDAIDKFQDKMGPITVHAIRRVLYAGDLNTL